MRFLATLSCIYMLFCASAHAAPEVYVIETDRGDIVVELYPDKAPITVKNFIRYIEGGYFEHGAIDRVVRPDNDNGNPVISVIQGHANLSPEEQPYPPIPMETTEKTGILHLDGTLSMARGAPDSATHYFFITLGEQPSLDYGGTRNPDVQGFSAFGRVIEGMDVVRAINALTDTVQTEDAYISGQILENPVVIYRITKR